MTDVLSSNAQKEGIKKVARDTSCAGNENQFIDHNDHQPIFI